MGQRLNHNQFACKKSLSFNLCCLPPGYRVY
jgi:hypothetical protein